MASKSWEDQPVNLIRIEDKLRCRRASQDIGSIIQSFEIEFLVEEELLYIVVRREIVWKGHLQDPPRLPVFLVGFELSSRKAGKCEGERRSEIVPGGVAIEVQEMKIIPLRFGSKVREIRTWIVKALKYFAFECLNPYFMRRPGPTLVRSIAKAREY